MQSITSRSTHVMHSAFTSTTITAMTLNASRTIPSLPPRTFPLTCHYDPTRLAAAYFHRGPERALQPFGKHASSMVTSRHHTLMSFRHTFLMPKLVPRRQPTLRCMYSASSLARTRRDPTRATGSPKILFLLGTALFAFIAVGTSSRSLRAEAPPEQLAENDGVQFAKSVEETESEERRQHGNPVVRWLYVVGDAVQDYVIEPLGTAKRFLVLVFLFMPVLLTMPMLLIGRRREGGRRRGRRLAKAEGGTRWGSLWWYGFLVKQMERAGPTFIKLAQWAGSRQDLFPKELCDLLGKLHSNGKPHSLAYTRKVIERVFGRPLEEVFEDFPNEPLGIGAVAQVYKATLRPDLLPPSYLEQKHHRHEASQIPDQLALTPDDERPPPAIPTASVAIKILHPKARRTIARDIRIMSFFANLLNAFPGAQWLSFPEEVDVFAEMMFSQLDLRNEAANLDRFEKNFIKRGSAISFPRPLIAFTSKEILIEEYEDALPLKYFLKYGGAGFDHRIANLGLDAFLSMLLLDNFTHADLHPGNIMVKFYRPTTRSLMRHLFTRVLSKFDKDYAALPSLTNLDTIDDQTDQTVVRDLQAVKHDQDAWLDELDRLDELGYQPELVFLDAGLTVELTPTNRKNFLELFSAVAEFDGALAGHLMVERCRLPDLVIDEDTFALKMQDLVLSVKSKTFSLAKIKIGDVLSQVLTAVREHHVKMEPDFVNTVISILLLEGIGRQLDPGMDLFKSALPILRNLGREMAMQEGGGMLAHGQDLKNLSPMIKLWFWMEARSWLLGVADRATVDAFVRYDWLSTAA